MSRLSHLLRGAVKRSIALLPAPLDLAADQAMRAVTPGAARAARRRTGALLARLGDPTTVQAGPFAGMRYASRVAGQGGLPPKLLGVYEQELHPALADAIGRAPATVVDIGAAEGYYAVGLARALPAARVVAFEMEAPLRTAVRRLARDNAVAERVRVAGTCTAASLQAALADAASPALVLSDCEGAEDFLLRPDLVPALRTALVLCETHEAYAPGVTAGLQARFAPTHDVGAVTNRPRGRADLPAAVAARFSDAEAAFMLDEGRRVEQTWLYCVPRGAGRP